MSLFLQCEHPDIMREKWHNDMHNIMTKKAALFLCLYGNAHRHYRHKRLCRYVMMTLCHYVASVYQALKGHSQLAHMRNGDHFIANLHITETQSTLCWTKYDKNNIIGWAQAHSKTGFSEKDWKSSNTLRRLKRNSRCALISGWGQLFSDPVSAVPKLTVFL